MGKSETYSNAVCYNYSKLTTRYFKRGGADVKAYVEGHLVTATGIVIIYGQGYIEGSLKLAIFRMVKSGKVYTKTIKGKAYTDIGLARKAGEFAEELYGLNTRDFNKAINKVKRNEF